MDDRIVEKIIKAADSYLPDIVKFLQDIISIPSFSTDERGVVERIKQEMELLGFDEVEVDALGNLIGRIGEGTAAIALDGHADTVGVGNLAAWSVDPFGGMVKDGRVYGLGACDQKAGIASMVYGAKIVQELNLLVDHSLYVTATVMEEECEGLNWRHIIGRGRMRPEFVIITEPTALRICRGHKGRLKVKIRTKGRGAHGSMPQKGENAIYKMGDIIKDLISLSKELKEDHFLGKGTIAVTNISSNSASENSVPFECEITIDRRLTLGENKDSAIQQLKQLPSIAVSGASVEVDQFQKPSYAGLLCQTEQFFPTWVLDEDAPLVQTAVEAYRSLWGSHPPVDKWDFCTNASVIKGVYGIPCVGFGPGDDSLAHSPDENVPVEHLGKAAMFYAASITSYVGK